MRRIDTKQWPFIEAISNKYSDAEMFLVGGAVRDLLLKRKVKDFDFVVRGVELKKLTRLLKTLGEVDLVGKRFGVIKFRPKGSKEQYDFALPRKEFSLSFSGAYKDFAVTTDHTLPIEEDLSRRDFTINAMAYNLITGEIVDPFFGQKDLKKKTIRTVGSSVTRFQEDYSRMLRAIRFACQLNFKITDKTAEIIKKLSHHVHDKVNDHWIVSREIISENFLKGFDANSVRCLNLYDELNMLEVVFPEIKAMQQCQQSPPYHHEGTVYTHTRLALKSIESKEFKKYFPKPIPLISKVGILFHDIGKPATATKDEKGRIHFHKHEETGSNIAREVCSRLRLGGSMYCSFRCHYLAWLVKHHLFSVDTARTAPQPHKMEAIFFSKLYPSDSLLHITLADQLASIPQKGIDPIKAFKILMKRIKDIAPQGKLPPPLISGEDVLEWTKMEPGPGVQTILDNVRDGQLLGEISTKEEAKKLVVGQ